MSSSLSLSLSPSPAASIGNAVAQYDLYGVHNTANHHSFAVCSSLTMLLPTLCVHCESYLSPFTDTACRCLRCGVYAHRACVSRVRACEAFKPRSASLFVSSLSASTHTLTQAHTETQANTQPHTQTEALTQTLTCAQTHTHAPSSSHSHSVSESSSHTDTRTHTPSPTHDTPTQSTLPQDTHTAHKDPHMHTHALTRVSPSLSAEIAVHVEAHVHHTVHSLRAVPPVESAYCVWRAVQSMLSAEEVLSAVRSETVITWEALKEGERVCVTRNDTHTDAENTDAQTEKHIDSQEEQTLSADTLTNTHSSPHDKHTAHEENERVRERDPGTHTLTRLQKLIQALLHDETHIAGLTFSVCHRVFLSLAFASLADTLRHARECVDIAICAALSACEESVLCAHAYSHTDTQYSQAHTSLRECVMLYVEREMLSLGGAAMYDKLSLPLHCASREIAKRWRWVERREREVCDSTSQRHTSTHNDTHTSPEGTHATHSTHSTHSELTQFCAEANSQSLNLSLSLSPKDKLTSLVALLRALSAQQSAQSSSADVGADALLNALCTLIVCQQREGIVDWLGESLFLSSIFLSPQVVDLNGAEGYALITLQQCMEYLLSDDV